jgi:calcium-dependent protein kinase
MRMAQEPCSTSSQRQALGISIHRTPRCHHRHWRAPNHGRQRLRVTAHIDYTATASDDGVLRLPPRLELMPDEIRNVFNYPRNIYSKYAVGEVIGAGSFGVVRSCTEIASGRKYAVKTVGKTPKRGPPTPR